LPELACVSSKQSADLLRPKPAQAQELAPKPLTAGNATTAEENPVVAVQPTVYSTPAPTTPVSPRPRSHGDLSADPRFDHADDYTWLTGRLEYLYVRNLWRIRYAGCDEEDLYGGSLVLTASFPVSEFKEGQLLHVEGSILHAEAPDHDGRPLYQVHAIQVLK
jgi:hypothetical protein